MPATMIAAFALVLIVILVLAMICLMNDVHKLDQEVQTLQRELDAVHASHYQLVDTLKGKGCI